MVFFYHALPTYFLFQGPMQGSSRMPRGARFTMHSDGPLRPLRPGTGATPAFPSHDRNFENFIQV